MTDNLVQLPDFVKGLVNRRVNPLNAPLDSVSAGENVILADGGIKTRPGFTVVHDATNLSGEIRALSQVIFPKAKKTYLLAQYNGTAQITWESVATGPERAYHAAAWDIGNGRMLLFGGKDSLSDFNNDLWSYDPSTDAWAELSPTGGPPSARHSMTMVYDSANECCYMFGGLAAGPTYKNDLWKLDCTTDTWSELTDSGDVPAARYGHAACMVGTTTMVVSGGKGSGGNYYYGRDWYSLNVSTLVWTAYTPADGPMARYYHSLVYDGSTYCYLVGGNVNDEFFSPECWRIKLSDNTVLQMTSLADTNGLATHAAIYCSGYVICLGGWNQIGEAWIYNVYNVTSNAWVDADPAGDPGARIGLTAVAQDTSEIILWGGVSDTDPLTYRTDGYSAPHLCGTSAGTGEFAASGLAASGTHLPTTAAVFEDIYSLTAESGVISDATLGDRCIVAEGITDYPLVFGPGLLSTDANTDWMCPNRVLTSYEGDNHHDVSDAVLDDDLDSTADIGGITSRGYILIGCDVPTVLGFYFEFETPNNAAGQITEFAETVRFNDLDTIGRQDIKGVIATWYQDSGVSGHFEKTGKALAGAAVDLGGSPNTVKIPCSTHGFVAGDKVRILNTTAYNNTFTLPTQTGGDANNFVIESAYTPETFADDDEARLRLTLGTGNDCPLIETGVKVNFTSVEYSIVDIVGNGDGDSGVELSTAKTSGAVTACYGITVDDDSDSVLTLARSEDQSNDVVAAKTLSGFMQWSRTYSYRFVVPAADIIADAGFIRLTLAAYASDVTPSYSGTNINNGCTFGHVSIVERSTGSTGTTTPTTVTFANGHESCEIAKGGTAISDLIAFDVDQTKDYLVTIECNNAVNTYSFPRAEAKTAASGYVLYVNTTGGKYNQASFGTATYTYYYDVACIQIVGQAAIQAPTLLHVATTTDDTQSNLIGIDSVRSVSATITEPGTSQVYFALARGGRLEWIIWDSGTGNWRIIAKLVGSTWQYNNGSDVFTDTGEATYWTALRTAFGYSGNQWTYAEIQTMDATDWSVCAGYPTLDWAVGLVADGDNLPTVTSITANVMDSGGSQVDARQGGAWVAQTVTDGTASGGVTFGQNGAIVFTNTLGVTADYDVMAGIPAYWFRVLMRGTSVGTKLTKVRYRARCQALQSIGDGQPDTVLGFVYHDVSAGKILDYAPEVSNNTHTELGSTPSIPMETTDYIYVQYLTKFNEIEIIPYDDNNQVVSSLIAWYWNGSGLSSLTIIDGTSLDGKTLCKRGKIKFDPPDDWKKNIPVEGLSYFNAKSGQMEIGYSVYLQVSVNVTTTMKIAEVKISPIPEPLKKYQHVAAFQNRIALANQASAPDQCDVSAPFLEYVWSGPNAGRYRFGGGGIQTLVNAWNTLMAGQPDGLQLLTGVTGQDSDMVPVEAIRHVPINTRVVVKAPMSGSDDGTRPGLFFLNQYGAYCCAGLQSDSNFATARFQCLSDTVSWWDSNVLPRIDKNYLHLACGEYWPVRNWIVWSVPMIMDYAFDPDVAVVQSTTKVRIKATGHTNTAGQVITITGMQNYSGPYTLHADTTTDWLVFTATYVAETTSRFSRYSVSGATQTTNNRLIVFDLTMNAWLPPFTIAAASLCTAYDYNANAPGNLGSLALLAGNYSGQILRLFEPTATDDNGTAITAYLDTQWMSFDAPEWLKNLRKGWLYGTVDNNFYITVGEDGKTYATATMTESGLTDPVMRTFTKAFRQMDAGTLKANLFKLRLNISGPADIQAVKLLLGLERTELPTAT